MIAFRPPRLDSIGSAIVDLGIRRPRWVITAAIVITVILAAATVRIEIDTDPENMLPSDDPVRVLNERIRDDFGTRNMIVLGIVDEGGVLTPETIGAASPLVDEIATLNGVVSEEIVSFKSAADVPSGELSQQDVDGISAAVNENALFAGRVISPNEQGLVTLPPKTSPGPMLVIRGSGPEKGGRRLGQAASHGRGDHQQVEGGGGRAG